MIALFLADGFEEIEALTTVDLLRRAGYQLVTVGVGSQTVTGAHNIQVKADITENQVETDEMEMVILPGGMPGTLNLEKSPIVQASICYCLENNKYLAAICAAPSILGHMGALKGRKATCFPGFEQELYGAQISDEFVCVDDKIITAKGAGVAAEFALKIVSLLSGENTAKKLRMSIQCM